MGETEQAGSGISWDYHFSKPCIPIVPLHIHHQHQAEAPGEDLEKFEEARLPTAKDCYDLFPSRHYLCK